MTVIHWFRRDLRVGDNTALAAAASACGGDVLPIFILDDDLLKGKHVAPARVQFMIECLRELDAQLKNIGSQLMVRRGQIDDELRKIVRETGATAVYFNRDYTPAALARDRRVTQSLQANGVQVESFKDLVIFEEDELLSGEGKPYTVFTPYKKAWLGRVENGKLKIEKEDHLRFFSIFNSSRDPGSLKASPEAGSGQFSIPSANELGFAVTQQVPQAGERVALDTLMRFKDSGALQAYSSNRDFPGLANATSQLSPHLRFGTISPRTCLRIARETISYEWPAKKSFSPASTDQKKDGADAWISELIWREFYHQVLYHFPHAKTRNFNRNYDGVVWGNGSQTRDDELFAAWCIGRTGYPIVDAAMRQMNATGWMHNRCRMIVASFLTKDLLLDWRLGERYFMRMLVDGDPAANNGGWQWAASTGTDAQPYFRIFNPLLQSQRFDADGAFIKRWVPELANVPAEFIHEPSAMPPMTQAAAQCIIGEDYPAPIVNHAEQKEEILRRFKSIKKED